MKPTNPMRVQLIDWQVWSAASSEPVIRFAALLSVPTIPRHSEPKITPMRGVAMAA